MIVLAIAILYSQVDLEFQHFFYRGLTSSNLSLFNTQYQIPWKLQWNGKKDDILDRKSTLLSFETRVPLSKVKNLAIYANRDEKITKSFASRRFESKVMYPTRISEFKLLPSFVMQNFSGPRSLPGNYGIQVSMNYQKQNGDLKIEQNLNLLGQSLTRGGYINSTLQYNKDKFGISGTVFLENIRYPLTHFREKRSVQEFKTELKIHPVTMVNLLLSGNLGSNEYAWDKVRNKDFYSGSSQINLSVGPAKISYEEHLTKEYLEAYLNGESLRKSRTLTVEVYEQGKSSELSFSNQVSVEFFQPPVQLSFNARNKRLIRSTLRFIKDFEEFKTIVALLFRTEDEVFMDPTRSSYTRRDEFYRIDGTVEGRVWSNRTSIVGVYSKFRFLPSRNLLIRYFEDEIGVNFRDFQFSTLLHIQDNGQYLPNNENQYLFHVQKKVSEFKFGIRVPAFELKFWKIYFDVSRYLRWEKRSTGAFNLTQSEKGIGVFIKQTTVGNLLVKWVDRLGEKPGLYISTRFELTI